MTGMRTLINESSRQSTKLAPATIQAVELLSVSRTGLASYILHASEENPLINVDFSHEIFACDEFLPSRLDGENQTERPYLSRVMDYSRIASAQACDMNLESYIRTQLPREISHAPQTKAVIEALDEDGYFRGAVWAIANEHACSLGDIEKIIGAVQLCDPPGIGARNLSECISLQLSRLDENPARNLALKTTNDGLLGAMRKAPGSLSRKYGTTRHIAEDALGLIKSCNPRPGLAFYQAPIHYDCHDIEINFDDGAWYVYVPGSKDCPLIIDQIYLRLLEDNKTDEQTRQYIEEKNREARSMVRNLDYRFLMLYRMGAYLLRRQIRFFESGGNETIPLSMKNTARDLAVSESTVNRIVSSKSLGTPFGIFPLKIFFTTSLAFSPMSKKSDDLNAKAEPRITSYAVKSRIRELIDTENPRKPISDEKITRALQAEGVEIRRRTVAKYRESMKIPSSSERRVR